MKRSRVKPKSDKRRTDDELYRFTKAVRFGLGESCRLILDGCEGRASEVHHRQSRGVAPARIFDVDNWLPACRSCHRWVTDNPAAAYDLEVSQRAGDVDPTPMLRESTCRACFGRVEWFHDYRGRSIVVDAESESADGTVELVGEVVPFHSDEAQRIVSVDVEPDGSGRMVDHRATCDGWQKGR